MVSSILGQGISAANGEYWVVYYIIGLSDNKYSKKIIFPLKSLFFKFKKYSAKTCVYLTFSEKMNSKKSMRRGNISINY